MSQKNSISGKLVVIDGTDGSGKHTQSMLLIDRLKSLGYDAVYFDFPRHGHPSAYLVDQYLTGFFGKLDDLNGAYIASTFYANDRKDAAPQIREVLERGGVAVCDRYVSANMGHQAGKIQDLTERDKYLAWLIEYEFNINKIPRPDLNMLLYASTKINQELVDKKNQRTYLNGEKRDIHENDAQHLDNAASAFMYCAKKYDWSVIYCAPTGIILPKEEIHELVWREVEKKFNI
ncbi:MAG: dTMP kinase [Candidatus Woesearchaeota archaeon]